MRGSYGTDNPYGVTLLEAPTIGFVVHTTALFSTATDPETGLVTGYTCRLYQAGGSTLGGAIAGGLGLVALPADNGWTVKGCYDINNRTTFPVGTVCWCQLDESHLGYVLTPLSPAMPLVPVANSVPARRPQATCGTRPSSPSRNRTPPSAN